MQEWRADASAMTFDTVSMERSKGFVQALQAGSLSLSVLISVNLLFRNWVLLHL